MGINLSRRQSPEPYTALLLDQPKQLQGRYMPLMESAWHQRMIFVLRLLQQQHALHVLPYAPTSADQQYRQLQRCGQHLCASVDPPE